MNRSAFLLAFSLSLVACATSAPQSPTPATEQHFPEFPLTMTGGGAGNQTGEWLKDVCRVQGGLEETCLSFMWGTLDALKVWPPRDGEAPYCLSGLSYGTIGDGVRSYLSGISDEEAGRTDAVTLIRRAVIARFPC